MKINILGTMYELRKTSQKYDERLKGLDGYHDGYGKIICVNKEFDNAKNVDIINGMKPYKKEVLRHEIIHAFFFESGLIEYSDNENIVNFIAVQFPKLLDIFKKVGAL